MALENDIVAKAHQLGISGCGIIKAEAMLDYGQRLQERMDQLQEDGKVYEQFRAFADVRQTYPWAKSIVVVALDYGHYIVPKNAKDHFGKAYLFDIRHNRNSPERKIIYAFEDYLQNLGLQTAMNEHPGITAYRWAASKAGLGIIRQNNFFYTQNGSWCRLCAWAIDQELELIGTHSLTECPPDCHRCIEACPTKSLSKPYIMNMKTCVSSITASVRELPEDAAICKQLGGWLYGCDACQDACPMNRHKWQDTDTYPGLAELNDFMTPEAILAMSYPELEQRFMEQFFYIKTASLWKWKINALNVMLNDYQPKYKPYIEQALDDEQQIVQNQAQKVLSLVAAE